MIYTLFFFAIIVLSQAPTLVRFADASSLAICFWRLLISGLLLSPLLFRQNQLSSLRKLKRSEFVQLLLSGAFLFLHFFTFFLSVQKTSVANSTILFSLNPVTTAIGAYWLFQERVTRHLLLSCSLGIAGVALLFAENFFSSTGATPTAASTDGNVYSLLSAIFFSGYILTGKRLRQKLPNATYTVCIYLQTAIYAAVAMLITNVPFTGYTSTTWYVFVALAVLPTLLGHAIFTYCLNFLNVNFMSCMTLIEPLLAALVANWLFHEPLTQFAAFGFLLTCASVVSLFIPTLTKLNYGR